MLILQALLDPWVLLQKWKIEKLLVWYGWCAGATTLPDDLLLNAPKQQAQQRQHATSMPKPPTPMRIGAHLKIKNKWMRIKWDNLLFFLIIMVISKKSLIRIRHSSCCYIFPGIRKARLFCLVILTLYLLGDETSLLLLGRELMPEIMHGGAPDFIFLKWFKQCRCDLYPTKQNKTKQKNHNRYVNVYRMLTQYSDWTDKTTNFEFISSSLSFISFKFTHQMKITTWRTTTLSFKN